MYVGPPWLVLLEAVLLPVFCFAAGLVASFLGLGKEEEWAGNERSGRLLCHTWSTHSAG